MDYEKEIDRLKQSLMFEARDAAKLRKLNKELSEHINKLSRGEDIDNQIYVILYTEYNSDSEVEDVLTGDIYFTNKDKAIIHLLEQDYKHICDDEYSAAWYLHAEIILLNKEEL